MKRIKISSIILILVGLIIYTIEYLIGIDTNLTISLIAIILSVIVFTKEKRTIQVILKNLITILLLLYISITYKNIHYLSIGLLEYSIIKLLLGNSNKTMLFKIINFVINLLFYVQELVLLFGGSYISMIMLTNISSLEDLSNNFVIYGTGIAILMLLSIVKIKSEFKIKRRLLITFVLILLEIFAAINISGAYSPVINYGKLMNQYIKYYQYKSQIRKNSKLYNAEKYYHESINNYITYNKNLGERPNIILFFTEGLSKSIMFDNRNIMPTLRDYYYKTITFDNYYNHTAATYRGIVGQLYSSYQLDNNDKNLLISIQGILKEYGYNTVFINTEPENKEFENYLLSFEFQNLITSDKRSGNNNSIKDKDAYEFIYDKALELNNSNQPFFISMYTYGTHASHDSLDYKYGDGQNPELNKFYNLDKVFGEFIEKFNNSELYDNTIVIFTTDHATYTDNAWGNTFTSPRYDDFIDQIPLLIYHKDVEPRIINVNGRNSLDLAPTILDYIDISSPNYFLGDSLFSNNNTGTKYDRTSNYLMNYISTEDSIITYLNYDDPIVNDILEYAAIASNKK